MEHMQLLATMRGVRGHSASGQAVRKARMESMISSSFSFMRIPGTAHPLFPFKSQQPWRREKRSKEPLLCTGLVRRCTFPIRMQGNYGHNLSS